MINLRVAKIMGKELTYKIWRGATAFFVAAGMAFSIVTQQPLAALVVLTTGFLILRMLRAKYREVTLVDERVVRIGEKAASTTFRVFLVSGALIVVSELMLKSISIELIPLEEAIQPLSYAVLVVMAIYWIFQVYYSRKM